MSTPHLGLVQQVGSLYESVVTAPEGWNDAVVEEWAVDLIADGDSPSKPVAREIRRCVRAAVKLRDFWLEPQPHVPSDAGDWRTKVDVALGIQAWRPMLRIAQYGLEEAPTEELFEETRRLFREVHASPWMEGVTFEEWLSDQRFQVVNDPER